MRIRNFKRNNYLRRLHRQYVSNRCIAKTWIKHSRKYTAPLTPLKTIRLPVSNVTKFQQGRKRLPKDNNMTHVLDGNWDKSTKDIEDTGYYQSIYDHFKKGVEWESTPLYTEYVDHFSKKDPSPTHGCTSIEQYKNRLSKLEEIYKDIKNNGYKSQCSIDDEFMTKSYNKDCGKLARAYPPVFDDVTINFSRDGEPILHEGRHRACMAKIINVDSIPVRVFIRHSEWQKTRDEYYINNKESTHPDIINP